MPERQKMKQGHYVKWTEAEYPPEELWVCPSCDAEIHVDSVGDKCPECGELAEDN